MTSSVSFDLDAISARGATLREFIVNTTIKVCRARTVNYNPNDYPGEGPDDMDSPGHESRVVDVLKPILDDWGIPHDCEGRLPERPAIFAAIGQGRPGARRLMYLLHTDTVPAGDPEKWSFGAFDTFEKNNMLYGRGVLDNKGPMVAALAALRILKDYADHIPGQVIFAALPDEEVQAGFGLDWLLANGKIACDEAIVPDIAGEMREINIAEKGRAMFRIKCHGKAAHAMEPANGVNAINGLAAVLLAIEAMEMPYPPHKLLSSPTLNAGIIRGGSAPNAVPEFAEVTLDVRFVPGQTEDAIKEQILGLCQSVAKTRPGVSFTLDVERGAPPIAVAPDAPIVRTILRHVPEAQIVGTGGGTFAHALVERGIDAVGWSPGHERTYHQPNEEISVDQLTTFAGRLAAVTLDRMTQP